MRFSIRDVLWLTVVAALVVGWSLDRVSLRRAELRARQAAERALYMSELARAQAELGRVHEEMARAAQLLSAKP